MAQPLSLRHRPIALSLGPVLGLVLAVAAPLPQAHGTEGLPDVVPGTGVDAAAARCITHWALHHYEMPGVAIALVQNGRLVLAKGFGVRDLATGAPVTADIVFQLASVSKTFTAASVAAVEDRKQLGWDQPMVSLLPEFSLADAGRWVNARDLLSHRAGFPAFFGDLFDHLGYDRADVLHRIRYVQPASSFRERPAYSNIGFFLAGELAAKAGGEPFTDLTQRVLFQPLGMNRTGTAAALFGRRPDQPGVLADVSRSHALVDDRLWVVPPNLSALFIPAGGFASSVNDLARFVAMLARGGEIDGRRVLSTEAVKELFEPVIADEPGFAEFPPIDASSGFDHSPGWGVYHYNGLKVLEQGGALDGGRTLLLAVAPGPADPRPPALPLSAYTGTYVNELFGSWVVAEHAGALEVLAGPARYRASLRPRDGETFHLLWPGVISAPVEVPFEADSTGRVTGFTYEGYAFRRS